MADAKKYQLDLSNNADNAYTNPKENPDVAKKWSNKNIIQYKDAIYDRISELLLANISKLDGYIEGTGISAIQKTYRDGRLVKGKNEDDVLVIYESDIEANADDRKVEDIIMTYLDFMPPEQLTLTIGPGMIQKEDEESEAGLKIIPNIILHAPGKPDFNLNLNLGNIPLREVNLSDNVSQFIGINQVKTEINRTKLKEYVDTEFSELTPITFTHMLEQYTKLKKQIPFYRFRTEDFFEEYGYTNIPIEYRIEKFFEEFERIKSRILAGEIAGMGNYEDVGVNDPAGNRDTVHNHQFSKQTPANSKALVNTPDLFGYGTMTYLLKEIRLILGHGDVLEWSTNDVLNFTQEIDRLNIDLEAAEFIIGYNSTAEQPGTGLRYELEQCYDKVATQGTIVPDAEPGEIFGCLDPAALNYDPNLGATKDYCVNPNGFETTTTCVSDGECSIKFGVTQNIIMQSSDVGNVTRGRAMKRGGKTGPGKTTPMPGVVTPVVTAQTFENPYVFDPVTPSAGLTDINLDLNQPLINLSTSTNTGHTPPEFTIYTPPEPELDNQVNRAYRCNASCIYPEPVSVIGTPDVFGCTDFKARNYNALANNDDGSCEYLIPGCTDILANNYDSNANIDDNSCDYTPADEAEKKSVFKEDFNAKWEFPDMINNQWFASGVRQVFATDGRDGEYDGAIRLIRKSTGNRGAVRMHKSPGEKSSDYYSGTREMQGPLNLKEGVKYKLTAWGRCNTQDTKAKFFIGDTRMAPGKTWQDGYSWHAGAEWNTNNNWTKVTKTFTAKRNKWYLETGMPRFPGVIGEIWIYDGTTNGAQPGQWCDYDDILVEEVGISTTVDSTKQNELVRISTREAALENERPGVQDLVDKNKPICDDGWQALIGHGVHGSGHYWTTTAAMTRYWNSICDTSAEAEKRLNEIDAELESLAAERAGWGRRGGLVSNIKRAGGPPAGGRTRPKQTRKGSFRIKGSRGGVGKPPQNGEVTACDCYNNSDCTQGNNGQCVNCRCSYFATSQINTADGSTSTYGGDPFVGYCPPNCTCIGLTMWCG